jgi:AraC-like DNA-binding protein
VSTENPFPKPDPRREIPRHDFEPFSVRSNEEWLIRTLDQLSVQGVTAVWYQCQPTWTLRERRIQDDMFLYVTKGRLHIRAEGREAVLFRGDSAHFRRGSPHSAATQPKHPTHIISFHYSATVFESLTLPELLDFPDVFHFGDDRVIGALLEEACREYYLRPAGYRRATEALAMRLLFRVIHMHGGWLRTPKSESKLADVRRLLPALESIRTELAQPLAIHELARRSSLSESQFRRVFRRTMGMLPVQYQRQVRMERACQLLRQTDLKVDSIAGQIGYAETAFFSHSF